MPEVQLVAVLVGTVAAFVLGGAYYGVLGNRLAELSAADSSMAPWKLGVELLRCLVLALVVAGLASGLDVTDWWGGVVLGLVLWAGFPLVLWVGAVVHEGTPVALAAIHAGDWLVKLVAVGATAGAWG